MMKRNMTMAKMLWSTTALAPLFPAAGLLLVNPAYAQSLSAGESSLAPLGQHPDASAEEAAATDEAIVVTGSLFRRTNAETASPVTVLSAETMERRGLNTVADAMQRISAGNAGTITQGWNNGNNFAAGANAIALRGLTVQSTLTVFDGLRMAPYPLADDGQRNFVDMNTIPNAIVERIEVLRDGASSTYGADAVAGVINVITKKQVNGLHLNGSMGISQRGDAGEQRFDATYGYGDLAGQGFNLYISGEYLKQDALWARDRGYPFNTSDWSRICNADGACMHNLNANGVSPDGSINTLFAVPGVVMVRPVTDRPPRSGPGGLLVH
jgi:iron complex outermembrane receptor protein